MPLAPRLDLKLFVHHGPYVRSRIAGRDELAGTDVILAHRLLKGAASRRTAMAFAPRYGVGGEALGSMPRPWG